MWHLALPVLLSAKLKTYYCYLNSTLYSGFKFFHTLFFSVPGSNLVYHIALRNHNKGKKVKYEKIKDDIVPVTS